MLDRQAFVAALLARVPEARPALDEVLDDHDGELLLHLFLGEVLRLSVSAFHAGDRDLSERILNAMAQGLEKGDDDVANAVAVSFVEDFGAGLGESGDFLALWPAALRRELNRQRGLIARSRSRDWFNRRASGGASPRESTTL